MAARDRIRCIGATPGKDHPEMPCLSRPLAPLNPLAITNLNLFLI